MSIKSVITGTGSYLPEKMVAEYLESKRIFPIKDAPAIDRRVYAVYHGYGERRTVVEEALGYLKGNGV